jgi:hypothetical protein
VQAKHAQNWGPMSLGILGIHQARWTKLVVSAWACNSMRMPVIITTNNLVTW